MADLTGNEAAQTVRIMGSDLAGVETTPVQATTQGAIHNNLRDSNGNELLGTKTSLLSIPVTNSQEFTYGTATLNLNTANAATDVFTISGSNSKIIKIKKITVSGIQTTSSHRYIILLKRSSLNTGGTSTLLTNVPFNSNNSASLAVVRAYTANPTLGTLVGNILVEYGTFPVQQPTNAQSAVALNNVRYVFGDNGAQSLTLNNVNELYAINLNGVTFTGDQLNISIEWTEE